MKKNMTKKKYIADLNGLPYLMSLEMVAGLTGLSYETIKKHCQKGAIKACKIRFDACMFNFFTSSPYGYP